MYIVTIPKKKKSNCYVLFLLSNNNVLDVRLEINAFKHELCHICLHTIACPCCKSQWVMTPPNEHAHHIVARAFQSAKAVTASNQGFLVVWLAVVYSSDLRT